MERIVLRHLSGSKANQVEEFPLNYFKELVFGRDPSASVKYDPDRDDLVGRQHAKLAQDPNDSTQFILTDLNSRNGTFVNRQRIAGAVKIGPGDTVQFGAGGPEFQFDLEPRPQGLRPTRMGEGGTAGLGSAVPTVPATRMGTQSPHAMTPGLPGPTMPASGQVGKATVERMIAQTKKQSTSYMILGGIALVVIIAAVAGVLIYNQISSNKQIASETKSALDAAAASAPLTPSEIAKNNTNSVVYIETSWKLIYTPSGGQVYHQYIPNQWRDKEGTLRRIVNDGRPTVAAYVLVGQNTVEPLLSLNANPQPIGGELTGSGFTVTSDGFVLTNRHVAATWRTSYRFPQSATPGVVIQNGDIYVKPDGTPLLVEAPTDWVPSETKQAGQSLQGGFEGRNDYLNVTFAKNQLRIPGKLARVSDRHDAAMIKIDVPESVPKVELNDNYDTIKPGDISIVLGYPGISPPVYGVIRSQDVFNRESQVKIIPDPSISVGNIGRVIRGGENNSGSGTTIISGFGDAYQLTINSTGAGNSGGPVFDERGRVTGIFFAGGSAGGASVTYAVPIRYGKELMSVTTVK